MIARTEYPHPGIVPVRTCVGCKERAAKSSLLRLVAAGSGIVPDPQARQPGRGAYLHPSRACFELAQRRRAFPRALRAQGPLDTGPLFSYLSRTDPPGIT
ncbi:MAG TPA: YlxR family protein [Trebonia sp.]|nr:YlxR family protein [Trebonia sp.]